jgi:hypothetical protein
MIVPVRDVPENLERLAPENREVALERGPGADVNRHPGLCPDLPALQAVEASVRRPDLCCPHPGRRGGGGQRKSLRECVLCSRTVQRPGRALNGLSAMEKRQAQARRSLLLRAEDDTLELKGARS